MANFGSVTTEIHLEVLGTPANFNGFRVFGFDTAVTLLTGGHQNFERSLAVSWAATLYIHFGGSCPLMEFCQLQNSLCVQVLRSSVLPALMYRTTAVAVSQTVAWYKEWNYETFAKGTTVAYLRGYRGGSCPRVQQARGHKTASPKIFYDWQPQKWVWYSSLKKTEVTVLQ